MGFRKNVSEALELPKEIMLGLPLLSLMGREELSVENYKGILEYGEECLRIGTASGILTVTGEGLCLCRMTAEILVVTGRLRGLEFAEE